MNGWSGYAEIKRRSVAVARAGDPAAAWRSARPKSAPGTAPAFG